MDSIFVLVYFLCGYMRGFLRRNTSNCCGCCSYRHACIRCHVRL